MDNEGSCKNIQRNKPLFHITEDIVKKIGGDYRTLPIFEKSVFEYTYRDHYSLQRNELLKCRWKEFKQNYEKRKREPVQFPDIRDYHFYNCRNRFLPSESVYKKFEHNKKLIPGPGVDLRGQIPIPHELFLKRGTKEKNKKGVRNRK